MHKINHSAAALWRDPAAQRLLLPMLTVAAGMLLSLGCERDQVSHASVTRTSPAAPAPEGGAGAAPGAAPVMPAGDMPAGQVPAPPRPSAQMALKWTLPKGWTETPGSGMRYATLTPPGGGRVEMSVVVLPGAAGGEMANVNRWRGQIGLPPLDDAALTELRKTVSCKAGAVAVFDFSNSATVKSRMVAGVLASPDGSTWFFKLSGDEAPVAKAKPAFMKYLETLHLD